MSPWYGGMYLYKAKEMKRKRLCRAADSKKKKITNKKYSGKTVGHSMSSQMSFDWHFLFFFFFWSSDSLWYYWPCFFYLNIFLLLFIFFIVFLWNWVVDFDFVEKIKENWFFVLFYFLFYFLLIPSRFRHSTW